MKHLALALLAVACSGSRHSDHAYISPGEKVAGRALTGSERQLLDANGFAILANADTESFHVGYTQLFHAHQPIFITADSILYAWHSSYDDILMQLELTHLIKELAAMLDELRDHLAGSTAATQPRADVDLYLAVGHALLSAKPPTAVAGGDLQAITGLVASGTAADGQAGGIELFGKPAHFDWSMFKPRGHYNFRPELQQYFRAMSWLGRAEIRIAQRDQADWVVDHRAFEAAKLLGSLFTAQTRKRWETIESTIGAFVGPPDSMSLPGLASGLATLGSSTRDADIVTAFEKLSTQKIRTQMLQAGAGDIAFVTLGPRFVFDSKVFTDVTYGNLNTRRMMPSPLDVGYAVFHNPIARTLLAKEALTYGDEYTKALEAAKIESTAEPALWEGSLYHQWLLALRALSPDAARDAKLPAPLTTDAWSRRMLLAQLASWAELRHDNLLYAKESFTGEALCAYPDAYVEPYPAFFAAMESLALKGKQTVERFPFKGPGDARLVAYFDVLRATMQKLHALADKERADQELTDDDMAWINHMVSINGRSGGCTTVSVPEGWYADLYFDRSKILAHEVVVADIHTQPTDEGGGPVGRVLHVGTGFPHMLVATLQHDGGKNRQTYRGFVSTYGELITEKFERLDDEAWRARVEQAPPMPPPWLEPILAH